MMGSERVVEMENVNLRKLLLDTLNSKPEFIGEVNINFSKHELLKEEEIVKK